MKKLAEQLPLKKWGTLVLSRFPLLVEQDPVAALNVVALLLVAASTEAQASKAALLAIAEAALDEADVPKEGQVTRCPTCQRILGELGPVKKIECGPTHLVTFSSGEQVEI